MKRKFTLAGWIIFAVLSIYTYTAHSAVKGAGAYRVGTTLGAVLSNSWQYTLLSSAILLVILMCGLLKYLKARKNKDEGTYIKPAGPTDKITTAAEALAETVPNKEKKFTWKHKKNEENKQNKPLINEENGKIKPKKGSDETELLPETEVLQKEDISSLKTEIMPENDFETGINEGPETEIMPPETDEVNTLKEETEVKKEEVPSPSKATDTSLEGASTENKNLKYCPNCGSLIKPGQRFCTKCGNMLERGDNK